MITTGFSQSQVPSLWLRPFPLKGSMLKAHQPGPFSKVELRIHIGSFFPIFSPLSRLRLNVRNIWWETRLRPLHALGLESVFLERISPPVVVFLFFLEFHLGASHSFSIRLVFKSSPTTAAAAAAGPRPEMVRGGASELGKAVCPSVSSSSRMIKFLHACKFCDSS